MIAMEVKQWYMLYNGHVATNEDRATATQVVQPVPIPKGPTQPSPGCQWCMLIGVDAKGGLTPVQTDDGGILVLEYHVATSYLTKKALVHLTKYYKHTVKRLGVRLDYKVIVQ